MLNDFIMVHEGLVPEDLCDDIIKEFADSEYWNNSTVGTGEVVSNVRSCDILSLSRLAGLDEIKKELDDRMFSCASEAINKYRKCWTSTETEIDTGYDLLRYREGQFYVQHTDSFKQQQRSISCSFALNDDYEGGEFGFFNRERVIKLKKGDALMFPSNFMFPHEIMPVTSGTRYSIITWYV